MTHLSFVYTVHRYWKGSARTNSTRRSNASGTRGRLFESLASPSVLSCLSFVDDADVQSTSR
jgi:hypothetical protein